MCVLYLQGFPWPKKAFPVAFISVEGKEEQSSSDVLTALALGPEPPALTRGSGAVARGGHGKGGGEAAGGNASYRNLEEAQVALAVAHGLIAAGERLPDTVSALRAAWHHKRMGRMCGMGC